MFLFLLFPLRVYLLHCVLHAHFTGIDCHETPKSGAWDSRGSTFKERFRNTWWPLD